MRLKMQHVFLLKCHYITKIREDYKFLIDIVNIIIH